MWFILAGLARVIIGECYSRVMQRLEIHRLRFSGPLLLVSQRVASPFACPLIAAAISPEIRSAACQPEAPGLGECSAGNPRKGALTMEPRRPPVEVFAVVRKADPRNSGSRSFAAR